jgi:hypothetical protein
MLGRAIPVMQKTEEEKRTEAEVSMSAPFAQMLCWPQHFVIHFL